MTESKAREYWLDMQDDPYSEDEIWTYKPRHRNDLIHVIEKSYANKLQAEIKAKDELLRECEEALDQSLRQWEMYANFSEDDMADRANTEAMLYKAYSKTLQKLREGKP